MRTSDSIAQLLPDFIKAQAKLANVSSSEKADAGKRGSYKYFNLAALRDHTMPILCQHNLTMAQTVDWGEEGYQVFSRVYHVSGEWIEARWPVPVVIDAQVMGSSITYGRRYTWMTLLDLHGDKDDDGAATSRGLGDYVTEAFSAKGMDPFHTPKVEGEPSRFASKTPYELLYTVMTSKKTLKEMDEWWDDPKTKDVRNRRLNPSFHTRLFIEYMKQAIDVATNATELSKFFASFSAPMEAVRSMDPHEADALDDLYTTKLEAFSLTKLDAG